MGTTWGPSGAGRTQVGPIWPHELCYLDTHPCIRLGGGLVIISHIKLLVWSLLLAFILMWISYIWYWFIWCLWEIPGMDYLPPIYHIQGHYWNIQLHDSKQWISFAKWLCNILFKLGVRLWRRLVVITEVLQCYWCLKNIWNNSTELFWICESGV